MALTKYKGFAYGDGFPTENANSVDPDNMDPVPANEAFNLLRLDQYGNNPTEHFPMIAGEDLTVTTPIPVVIGTGLPETAANIVSGTCDNTYYWLYDYSNHKMSTSFLMPTGRFNIKSVSVTGLRFSTDGTPDVATFVASLYLADANGKPTGSALATSGTVTITYSGGSFSANIPYTGLVGGNRYAVVIDMVSNGRRVKIFSVGHSDGSESYNADCKSYYWDGSAWQVATSSRRNLFVIIFNYTSSTTEAGKVHKANANDTTLLNYVGMVKKTVAAGGTAKVKFCGVIDGFSGLTIGSTYYLANTAGTIQATAGANSVKVGRAISATKLLIYQLIA